MAIDVPPAAFESDVNDALDSIPDELLGLL